MGGGPGCWLSLLCLESCFLLQPLFQHYRDNLPFFCALKIIAVAVPDRHRLVRRALVHYLSPRYARPGAAIQAHWFRSCGAAAVDNQPLERWAFHRPVPCVSVNHCMVGLGFVAEKELNGPLHALAQYRPVVF
ncbi:hypothetical protein B0T10DRAFT_465532 [Thelonectria olida]|uniref:Secreted protein n=1 Tax=Thelonectria olida TaxID=1576542 RepID=A0A9P8VVV6_9HYPO|nr:hypothetical protein B0T10DRAFT_465532 [Thelonectria olida]